MIRRYSTSNGKLSAAFGKGGASRVEVAVVILVLGMLASLLVPLVLRWRETSRLQTCRNHLREQVLALHNYHDTYGSFPPAAVWSTSYSQSLALHASKRVDQVTHENWAILLLPYLGEDSLWHQMDRSLPIGAKENEILRTATVEVFHCPADHWNHAKNMHEHKAAGGVVKFARGNYGINGGTHNGVFTEGSTHNPHGDLGTVVMNRESRTYQRFGNGIAGFNKSFRNQFVNGQATIIAIEELRAGIHPCDPRGVWALGQIGGSVTWGHGVNSDNYGPNRRWVRADDILGCAALHQAVGAEMLQQECMPCVDYVDMNQQATSRSLHRGGIQAAFLDGSVRFLADDIDPGLWHVLHSRETPAEVLESVFEKRSDRAGEVERDKNPPRVRQALVAGEEVTNALGMMFVALPEGTYQMGIPDRNNDVDVPDMVPAHPVRVSSFLMGKHEVTKKQYCEVMGSGEPIEGDYPVVDVTWNDAEQFCRRLSDLKAEKQAGRHYRLPTEAEWEYACRSGKSEAYYWRAERLPDDISGEAAGIKPALPISPIGSYAPNAFGLYDMRGNAWEWTADWFERDYYSRSPVDNPRGPLTGHIKVVRGGDWRFVGEVCHIDYPMLPPWKSSPYVGFRAVCEIRDGGE